MSNWSGFWGDGVSTTGSYEFLSKKSPNRYHLARLLKTRGLRNHSEVIKTLLADSTPASTASVTIAQIDAVANTSGNVQGGVRTVTSREQIDAALTYDKDNATPNTARAVAAADVTNLNLILEGGAEWLRKPSSYPTDASGNGGGGKLGR